MTKESTLSIVFTVLAAIFATLLSFFCIFAFFLYRVFSSPAFIIDLIDPPEIMDLILEEHEELIRDEAVELSSELSEFTNAEISSDTIIEIMRESDITSSYLTEYLYSFTTPDYEINRQKIAEAVDDAAEIILTDTSIEEIDRDALTDYIVGTIQDITVSAYEEPEHEATVAIIGGFAKALSNASIFLFVIIMFLFIAILLMLKNKGYSLLTIGISLTASHAAILFGIVTLYNIYGNDLKQIIAADSINDVLNLHIARTLLSNVADYLIIGLLIGIALVIIGPLLARAHIRREIDDLDNQTDYSSPDYQEYYSES